MPYKEIGPFSAIDIKKNQGQAYMGQYVGKQEITTKIGQQMIWKFESDEGPFGVYGFTNLNRIMENVPEGTDLKITYTGQKRLQTKFGMKDVHQVKVEAWSEEGEEPKGNEPPPFTDEDVPF